jgi:hypothetical protein
MVGFLTSGGCAVGQAGIVPTGRGIFCLHGPQPWSMISELEIRKKTALQCLAHLNLKLRSYYSTRWSLTKLHYHRLSTVTITNDNNTILRGKANTKILNVYPHLIYLPAPCGTVILCLHRLSQFGPGLSSVLCSPFPPQTGPVSQSAMSICCLSVSVQGRQAVGPLSFLQFSQGHTLRKTQTVHPKINKILQINSPTKSHWYQRISWDQFSYLGA